MIVTNGELSLKNQGRVCGGNKRYEKLRATCIPNNGIDPLQTGERIVCTSCREYSLYSECVHAYAIWMIRNPDSAAPPRIAPGRPRVPVAEKTKWKNMRASSNKAKKRQASKTQQSGTQSSATSSSATESLPSQNAGDVPKRTDCGS